MAREADRSGVVPVRKPAQALGELAEARHGKRRDARRVHQALVRNEQHRPVVDREQQQRIGNVRDAVQRPELGEVADVCVAPAVAERDQASEPGAVDGRAHRCDARAELVGGDVLGGGGGCHQIVLQQSVGGE